MEFRFLHLYPDLMSLYGSYANVSVLVRQLELLGHSVRVESVAPGDTADLAGADFLFLGAGTERSQQAALEALSPMAADIRSAAGDGLPMLFAGTAMELLGASITGRDGQCRKGLEVASFTSVQGDKRIVGDVYGTTDLYEAPVVGFMNKCAVISGVETPLITACAMGFGNEQEGGAEGFHHGNIFASELTGPLLVKNPGMLGAVAAAVCARRGADLSADLPALPYLQESFAVTAEQLRLRCESSQS